MQQATDSSTCHLVGCFCLQMMLLLLQPGPLSICTDALLEEQYGNSCVSASDVSNLTGTCTAS